MPRPISLIRLATFVGCSIPLQLAAYWTLSGQLGANPVETLTHHTGNWGLRLLLLTLAMTPLRTLSGQTWPIHIRRQLGLWSFTYLSLHFGIYLVFDLGFDPAALSEDLIERTWITAGFTAWAMLVPLAATSTRGWQRRLGRRWKSLHRLIYAAVLLGVIHYIWQTKITEVLPYVHLAILLALLALRLPQLRHRLSG